jgi:RNA polymerase sigma-70 factor (ECF subfamily)
VVVDTLLARLRERIVAFAASRISRESAEDLAQEVLVVIHEKYGHLERLEDLLPLSLQIMRFKMMAAKRKSYRHGEHTQTAVDDIQLPDRGPDPEEATERQERLKRLAAAMQQLGERCRKIMAWKLDGKTFPEIRVLLDAESINTVYTWDFRCRKQLLELMGGSWDGSSIHTKDKERSR